LKWGGKGSAIFREKAARGIPGWLNTTIDSEPRNKGKHSRGKIVHERTKGLFPCLGSLQNRTMRFFSSKRNSRQIGETKEGKATKKKKAKGVAGERRDATPSVKHVWSVQQSFNWITVGGRSLRSICGELAEQGLALPLGTHTSAAHALREAQKKEWGKTPPSLKLNKGGEECRKSKKDQKTAGRGGPGRATAWKLILMQK